MSEVQKHQAESRGSPPDRPAIPFWLRTDPSYPRIANAAIELLGRVVVASTAVMPHGLSTRVLAMGNRQELPATGQRHTTHIEPAELRELPLGGAF